MKSLIMAATVLALAACGAGPDGRSIEGGLLGAASGSVLSTGTGEPIGPAVLGQGARPLPATPARPVWR